MPSTIRINATEDLLKVLQYLRTMKFELMDNAEIIRAVLSDYYAKLKNSKESFEEKRRRWAAGLPELKMTPKEKEKFLDGIEEARKSGFKTMTREELWDEVESN